ncbi:zinc finger protein 891-like [Anopheles bellator]|uniref:zinc finger protein 891-like n=1 Tax=Anopheles bellator TaxID=139047 RepID=UPI00264762B1|nr:zinc finger protein 891-like [Anopheles bellator]
MEMETIIQLKEALSSGDSSVCRLCLSPDVTSEPLTQDPSDQYLVQKIFDCTSIQIVPLTGISSVLCTDCKTRVEDFYLFRYQCIKNNDVLNEFAAQISKSLLDEPESEKTVYSNELVQQSNSSTMLALRCKERIVDYRSNQQNQKCNNAQEPNMVHEFHNHDGINLPEENDLTPKPFQCKTCHKSFNAPSSLLIHRRIHTNDRRYQCSQCPAKFYDSSSLKTHIRYHTGERPYVCKVCDKAFYTPAHLRTHAKIHNKDEQHQCSYCPASFTQPAQLKIHIRTHTGERPFMCEICGNAFYSAGDLNKHVKNHTKKSTISLTDSYKNTVQ